MSENSSLSNGSRYEVEHKDEIQKLVHLTDHRATMPIKRRPSSKSPCSNRSLQRLRTDVARYVLGDKLKVELI